MCEKINLVVTGLKMLGVGLCAVFFSGLVVWLATVLPIF